MVVRRRQPLWHHTGTRRHCRVITQVYTRRHCRPQRHRGIYASSLPPLAPDRSRHHRRGSTQVYTRRHCRRRRHTGTRVVIAAAHSSGATCYWHCPHSMRSRVYATVGHPSVRPAIHLSVMSVCPSVLLGCRCCGFAAVVAAATRYRSIAVRQARPAGAGQRSAAAGPQHGAQQQTWGVPRCQLA